MDSLFRGNVKECGLMRGWELEGRQNRRENEPPFELIQQVFCLLMFMSYICTCLILFVLHGLSSAALVLDLCEIWRQPYAPRITSHYKLGERPKVKQAPLE